MASHTLLNGYTSSHSVRVGGNGDSKRIPSTEVSLLPHPIQVAVSTAPSFLIMGSGALLVASGCNARLPKKLPELAAFIQGISTIGFNVQGLEASANYHQPTMLLSEGVQLPASLAYIFKGNASKLRTRYSFLILAMGGLYSLGLANVVEHPDLKKQEPVFNGKHPTQGWAEKVKKGARQVWQDHVQMIKDLPHIFDTSIYNPNTPRAERNRIAAALSYLGFLPVVLAPQYFGNSKALAVVRVLAGLYGSLSTIGIGRSRGDTLGTLAVAGVPLAVLGLAASGSILKNEQHLRIANGLGFIGSGLSSLMYSEMSNGTFTTVKKNR